MPTTKTRSNDAAAWSDKELSAAVDAYLEMMRLEQAGLPVSKKAVYRSLASQYGRTEKAFEYRMQNISAVRAEQGEGWIKGLPPAVNVGERVKGRLMRLLASQPDGSATLATSAKLRKPATPSQSRPSSPADQEKTNVPDIQDRRSKRRDSATRIPAAELYQIQQEDLLTAIAQFRDGALPPTFNDSSRFDLLVDGNRRLPPKAIVALAARRPLGRVLVSTDLSGGESSAAFRLLLERGFEVATKLMSVGEFDASFSVGRNRESAYLIVESRGPSRNTDYVVGFEALLHGLADLDASIEDILIDSSETRKLPVSQRRPELRTHRYPIRLRALNDLTALRREITAAAAGTGRGPEATGSGNPTKRLRIAFTEPGGLELFQIALSLSQAGPASNVKSKAFIFQAQPPVSGGDETTTRKAMGETEVARIHNQMQRLLYDALVLTHGSSDVSCEVATASGRPADIIVRLLDSYELFEIKTALAPRGCVRQALGQLLEYAFWPGSPTFSSLWVVGPTPIDDQTQQHLDGLRQRFKLPLHYRHVPPLMPSR
jgi:hypothetical protein